MNEWRTKTVIVSCVILRMEATLSLYDFACLIIIFFVIYAIISAKYGER